MKKYKIIIDFLRVIGATRETKRYLKLFHKGEPTRFAVIRIGGQVLEKSKDLIAMDLAYLSNLNLYPIVIHGGGPQIDKALHERHIKINKIDGLRVTTRKQLPIIKKVLDSVNADFVAEINKFGGSAMGFTEDIFISEKHSDERLGYVGVVKKVNLAPIIRAIKNKKIPVISCLGFDEEGRTYNINADTSAKAAVIAIKPKKYILITEEGGIRDTDWKVIPNINILEETELLDGNGIVKDGMLHKLREIKNLLEEIKYNLPVQITSSNKLLKELFTDKGSGTFIKYGVEIDEHQSYDGVDKNKLKKLIENSFGKILKDGFFDKPVSHIFLDKKYRAVAIVHDVEGLCYLDKFCVTEEAQGEGLASDLWRHLVRRCKNLFWRSRATNPINGWYFEKSHGALKFDKWFLFWLNLNDEQIKKVRDYILSLEESLLSSDAK